MSANEKELRAAQKAERKAAAAAEADKKNRSFRRNAIIVAVIFVVLIAFALLVNSNYFYTHTTALTVGSTKYSPAEVNYFYRSTYNGIYQNLYNQLGDSTSMILDRNTPLDQQPYPYGEDENMTWADAIKDSAQQDMVRVTALYDAAVRAGRTLTADEQSAVDSDLAQMTTYATGNGYASLDKFLLAYFGKGVNTEVYTRMQNRVALASAYSQDLESSFSYTADQLSSYYTEHAAELDTYHYYNYPINSSDSALEGLEGDELKAKMHEYAQQIADATTDLDSMTEAVRAYTGENTVLSIASNPADNIGAAYKDWITDPARQKGDVAEFDGDSASYVVMFVERNTNDYKTADFRHILVKATPDEDGNYTEDALAAAKEKAELLLKDWSGTPTEDNFAELARLNSEDTGSTANGGLYTDVTKYTMVPGVNSFLFDEGKVPGDTGIVFGQSSAYTGYHVMYYVGQSEQLYSETLAENALRQADYDAALAELSDGMDVVEGSGLRFVQAL